MSAATARRGQPLVVLVLLLVGWSAMRAVLWETPFLSPPAAESAPFTARPEPLRPLQDSATGTAVVGLKAIAVADRVVASPPATASVSAYNVAVAAAASPLIRPGAGAADRNRAPAQRQTPLAPAASAAGNQLKIVAASERMPIPAQLSGAPRMLVPPAAAPAVASGSLLAAPAPALARFARWRWSADSWLLYRPGSASVAAAGQAGYGGSQAGGVLRYSLAPASRRAPAAYARVSRALALGEGEVALGLSARPLGAVPMRLLAEARVQRSGGATRLRPAASLVSTLPPQPLPLDGEAQLYAQAGYVGGSGATPFFDVQLTAERAMAQAGAAELRLGGGVWAGGQKGATRVDFGPRASFRLGIDPAHSRLALDWRFRIAGNARPGSGPALTVSAGF